MRKITEVPGVGKALQAEFAKLGIFNLEDVLLLSPRDYIDRRDERTLRSTSIENPTITCRITILSHSAFAGKKGRVVKVTAEDDDGSLLDILCFNRDYLEKMLRIGTSWYITATVQKNRNIYQTASFEIKKTKSEVGLGKIIPVYPLAGNLTQKAVRNAVDYALRAFSPIEDPMPYDIYQRNRLMHMQQALETLHSPADFESLYIAKRSLAFTELFMMELKMLRGKPAEKKRVKSLPTKAEKMLISKLPFSLTKDQEKVLDEIRSDLDSDEAMNRLLQGDVGSGKTLVAWLSALHVISKGGQVAFMAPTELLARQHAETAVELLSDLGVRIAFVTGDVKGKGRELLLKSLANGEIDLAIGTHALFSSDIVFKNLQYAIIDEQHRFGVAQRDALKNKGLDPNILSMTATPIPRTLGLTIFSDLDISTIETKPSNRLPIKTHIVSEDHRQDMFKSIAVEFERGHQAYFVYPRIDDEGTSDLKDVTSMFQKLQEIYPGVPSRLIHSKLEEEEKMEILTAFREKKLSYLVSTSVVEVGIDIPDATCMVIEHADRFGLAALHQLRGRVGRSSIPSYCFLVCNPKTISEDGKERLKIMRETNDGFLISEKDLEIRGPGDFIGKEQSGFLQMHFATLTGNFDLIEKARTEAERILEQDKGLLKAENASIRNILLSKVIGQNSNQP